MEVETIAKEYIRRQLKRGTFHDEPTACCSIVIDSRLLHHQRGVYRMALSNDTNLAVLRRAVDDELALLQGYEPKFMLVEDENEYNLALWENDDDLFGYLQDLGFPRAYLHGLSDGYEGTNTNESLLYNVYHDEYHLGSVVGEQVSQIVKDNAQHFINFQNAVTHAP